MTHLILAINPGSTSTKIAVFKDEEAILRENISHLQIEIESFKSIVEQIPMRKALVLETMKKHGIKPGKLSACVGRGGLLPPIKTGGYRVNAKMLDLVRNEKIPPHASNLGSVIAYEIAAPLGLPAYIYDAVSAADLPEFAKITGLKEITRQSFYHVLNSRASAMNYAQAQNRDYNNMNVIVAHLGGGITVGAHAQGKVVDSVSDDNGPFAPERAGGVPLLDFIELCYSGKYTKKEMTKKVRGMGGLRDLLGTSDGREIIEMVSGGDTRAALVMEAQAYQIAKGVTLMLPALQCKCDAIILTGGLAYNSALIENVKKYLGNLAPVAVMPGELEMEALAMGCLRILRGAEEAKELE
ncbi:MAG: butyrate kinase [Defluviitaleaceae bacterium]|nr:butyrate kinase [Defluviitaleaceae bacterium]MCL2837009.1 butyrate kinase [Defluviitaleaceae bacterium]